MLFIKILPYEDEEKMGSLIRSYGFYPVFYTDNSDDYSIEFRQRDKLKLYGLARGTQTQTFIRRHKEFVILSSYEGWMDIVSPLVKIHHMILKSHDVIKYLKLQGIDTNLIPPTTLDCIIQSVNERVYGGHVTEHEVTSKQNRRAILKTILESHTYKG